jgi:hypothetical protein
MNCIPRRAQGRKNRTSQNQANDVNNEAKTSHHILPRREVSNVLSYQKHEQFRTLWDPSPTGNRRIARPLNPKKPAELFMLFLKQDTPFWPRREPRQGRKKRTRQSGANTCKYLLPPLPGLDSKNLTGALPSPRLASWVIPPCVTAPTALLRCFCVPRPRWCEARTRGSPPGSGGGKGVVLPCPPRRFRAQPVS